MATSAIGSVVDTLRSSMANLAALSAVNIFSGPVAVDEAGLECVAFGDARLGEEVAAMGGVREETWTMDAEMRIVKPWDTDTETTIAAVRDRAFAILAAIETHINDTYTGDLPDINITAGQMTQTFGTEGRICWLSFTLEVMTMKNP